MQSFLWYLSFRIIPSFSQFNTLCLATSLALHKLVYQTSSAIILSSFAFSFSQSWNSHLPPPGWWCWAESWPFSSELYSLEYSINPELPEIFFTPQLSCWPSHRHSFTQRNMAPTYWLWQFCLISGTSWLFNLALSSSHWSRWRSWSHFSIILEIQTFPLSQLTSTWIFRTYGY